MMLSSEDKILATVRVQLSAIRCIFVFTHITGVGGGLMSQKNWQKIKLVRLLELLRQESDEQHPLTTNQICDYMLGIDIPCDRRVVSHDVGLLNEMGFEILETW
ncbi:MAG: hypothetical protein LUE12_06490 [Ruminococcus sp.]|nr:hypothetical protein [Ruminococcus sp.]